jgi:hypothetical protein
MAKPDMTKGTGVNGQRSDFASEDTFALQPSEYGGDYGTFAGAELEAPGSLTVNGTVGKESSMLGAMYRAADGHEPDVDPEQLSKRVK